MKTLLRTAGNYLCMLVLGTGITCAINALAGEDAYTVPGGGIMFQIDPETEELDQVSEPVGDISEQSR